MRARRRNQAKTTATSVGRLLRLQTVAERLDCGVDEVRKLIRRGQLRKTTWNRTPRVEESDLAEFIAQCRLIARERGGRQARP
ncbi:MAG: helix-turn-helix domain-containing protein [Phycisphaerae bacterium]|nr:helix-turn-helix domain-containing protein [Phycisphaerae bacterium]